MLNEQMDVVPRAVARLDGNEWLSEKLHRPGGRWIAQRLFATWVMPNHLTFVSGFLGIVAGTLLLAGGNEPWLRVAGGIVLWFSCLFDCADGELARARHQQSPLGMMLDGLTDNVIGTSVFVGMAYAVVAYTGNSWMWILGVAAGLSAAAHVWVYDAHKKQYMRCIGLAELEDVQALTLQCEQARQAGRWFEVLLLTAYDFFRTTQGLGVSDAVAHDPVRFRNANLNRMRAWTMMGSSMHFIALYTAAILSPLWAPSMLACVLFYVVGLNAVFVVLLLGKWNTV